VNDGTDNSNIGAKLVEYLQAERRADLGQEADDDGDGDGKRESQASELVKFVLARCDLAHDENGDVFAIDRKTREVRPIERRAFKNWLLAAYYESSKRAARSQSYAEAVQTLTGIGRHKGELVCILIRCAAVQGGYVIDLAEPGNSRAIRVEPGSWRIVDDPGVLFVRPESLKPLPEPVSGANAAELWPLLNVPECQRLLILTWSIDSLRPDTPFPVLDLIGEQGSAKSLTQTILRSLIDPSTTEVRSAPKNSEDLFVGAGVNWLLAYDNVSHLSADLQDTLCRIATGATHATRRLYTNHEEATIRAKRPISINGIGASITAQDLVDRTISLELPPIEDRRERADIERAFDAAHGRILGGLLDLFAAALAKLPGIEIPRDRRPRLIEYARLGCAVAEATGQSAESFLEVYENARAEAVGRTIDASPVATALIDWLEGRPDREGEHSIKSLFENLPRPQMGESWPRSPKGFADALRRAAPALRTLGIEISRSRKSHGQKVIAITRRKSPAPSPRSPQRPPNGEDPGTLGTSGTSSGGLLRDAAAAESACEVICSDCRHFKASTNGNGLGICVKYGTDAAPSVPFRCPGFQEYPR
jgi:hypothetical protein